MGEKTAASWIRSPDGSARGVDLDGGPVVIGRRAPDHDPDVALEPDPRRWVGRPHCTLDLADGMWSVTDDAGVNGTLWRHGDSTVRIQGRKRLQHRDVILILGDMTSTGDRHGNRVPAARLPRHRAGRRVVITYAVRTRPGRRHADNQDRLAADAGRGTFIVADGIGGMADGAADDITVIVADYHGGPGGEVAR